MNRPSILNFNNNLMTIRPKITQTIIIHSHMKNLLHKEGLFISELLKTDGVVQKECLSH